ncbi:MarR family winged helix-turn-helix transcriptional regulator [Roseinatronobacter alkalisoli]|uniref:MarR family winged helix-turn-helix transcriptional regulator n=1 Tax=Roseinatronobacter alkalisoli TaxID=3028235 RepID=A0ABT5T728_9RHOB|nr:MarR family winged helix-turn-helix transcriptional regulator [Roseinatronobacter sp. HJB301]MDD7970934.1 MarR family winged helix-turn-helix transcriptional regulator [Roseinatronobacter sp. HJB301]
MKEMSTDGFTETRPDIDGNDLAMIEELSSFYDRPGFLIRRANQIAVSSFMEDLGELGITPTQMSSLVVISETPQIDQITLARRIGVDRTTISMVVNGLVEHGFVRREQSSQDARRKEIVTTRAGRACAMLARDNAVRNNARLLGFFTEAERECLAALLRRLIDDVPAHAPDWIRPDGTTRFGTESTLARDFPEHANLYNAFGFLLRRTHQTLESVFIETTKSLRLTPRRYGVLRIVDKGQPVEQISVARWLALDGSTTATLVTELVRRGFIMRDAHPHDRRRRLLRLTDAGKQLITDGHPLAFEASQKVLAVLGKDTDTFRNLIRRFIVENDEFSRVPLQRAVTLALRQADI